MKSAWSELLPLAIRHGVPARGFGPEEVAGALLANKSLNDGERVELERICGKHGIVPMENTMLLGRRERVVTKSKIRMMMLKFISESEEPTTPMIARALGIHHKTAGKWLRQLKRSGDVIVVSAGPKQIWRPAEGGR